MLVDGDVDAKENKYRMSLWFSVLSKGREGKKATVKCTKYMTAGLVSGTKTH